VALNHLQHFMGVLEGVILGSVGVRSHRVGKLSTGYVVAQGAKIIGL
jgi:hypothetical protein